LKGHSWVVSEVNFHPNGRHLVSHSWREGETFLWDVFPGKMLFSCEGMQSRFNRDGSRLAFRAVDSVGIWKVSLGQAYLSPPTYTATTLPVEHCDYSPDGTLLAAAGHSRIDIWNTKTWRLLERLEMQRPLSVHFDPSGESLLVCHKTGLDRIPIHRSGNEIFTGEQESLPFPADVAPFHLAQSQDGRTIVADLIRPIEWTSAESLWLYSDGQQPRVLKAYESLRFITCTPDGRWAATGNWTGQGAVIWDLTTGQPMRRFDTASNCVVAFGPKGERLAIADTNSLTLRESHSWRVEHQIPRASLFAALAFSSDARMLAMTDSDSRIQLLDVNEARVVATLGTNDNPSYISWMRFRPDGKQLAVCLAVDGLRVWDLRKLRDGLRELNLDWDW